jgi:hypothetical protein
MVKANRKSTTPHVKTADDALFKLHDKFCEAYSTMLSLQGQGGSRCPVNNATKEEEALERKWHRAVDIATKAARAIIDAPAHTLEGMLMKIHIAGFAFDCTKLNSFRTPYHSGICASGICAGAIQQHWEISEGHDDRDEFALIVSLREDLERFAGRRA